jgi:hypothetical protein
MMVFTKIKDDAKLLSDWLDEMEAEEKYQEHSRKKGLGHVR